MRCAIFCSSDLDALTCCPGVEGTKAAKVVQTMLATTHGVQLRVLQALSLGCVTNEAMAEAIGVDKRTIEVLSICRGERLWRRSGTSKEIK